MTKEEYESLLQSDYWKGYSYSLIKERNFTCEDCGRSFPNMRNMLQVHHLVYRDTNPWSYKPEELIVLCKECHQKRHGINPNKETDSIEEETITSNNNTTSSYTDNSTPPYTKNYAEDMSRRYAYNKSSKKEGNWLKYAILTYLIIILIYFIPRGNSNEEINENAIEASNPTNVISEEKKEQTPSTINNTLRNKKQVTKQKNINTEIERPVVQKQDKKNVATKQSAPIITHNDIINEETKSTIELLDERNHAKVVKDAERAGISTEGSTIDILERINHARVVKDAERAGVSTEGSTIDILERMNRKYLE